MSFFFPFGLVELGLVVLAAAALMLLGRRAAPDPTGRRPFAVYLLSVMFVTLVTTAGAVAQIGRVVAREAIDEDPVWAVTVGESFTNYTPVLPESRRYGFIGLGDVQTWSDLLKAGLMGLLAASIFEFHRRQWNVLLVREVGDG